MHTQFSKIRSSTAAFHSSNHLLCCNSPASEFYMPMFRNTLYVPSSQAGRYEGLLPRRKHKIFRTRRKFEIKNHLTTTLNFWVKDQRNDKFMGYVRYTEEYNIKMDLKRHIFRNARVWTGSNGISSQFHGRHM